jgi:peptidoglycan/xylan/chitin deacetylase (PgdA/CDA1 family)
VTIDDGHRSIYRIAFPLLKEFGYPATLFVYSDYIDHGGLRWQELDEMVESGLITVQSHSKTHDNLTRRRLGRASPVIGAGCAKRSTVRRRFYAGVWGARSSSTPILTGIPIRE